MNKAQLETEILSPNDVTWFCATPFLLLILLRNEELEMLYLSCIRL